MPKQQLKRGRWGKDEIAFMSENATKLSARDIATHLNRDIETVKTWVKENLALDLSGNEPLTLGETEIRNKLRASPEWEELKDQFVEGELKLFENKYSKLMLQFKNDVLPTEETQIFLLIKLEILMGRNLKGRQRAITDMERIEGQLNDIYAQHRGQKKLDDEVHERLLNLERQLAAAREAEASKTGEYVKLSEKHSALMKELKGTRDQRVSKIENSKQSFLGLIRLLQEEEVRQAEGEEIALMDLATVNEIGRLSQTHKYVDDSMDQPLLTPETVEENEE